MTTRLQRALRSLDITACVLTALAVMFWAFALIAIVVTDSHIWGGEFAFVMYPFAAFAMSFVVLIGPDSWRSRRSSARRIARMLYGVLLFIWIPAFLDLVDAGTDHAAVKGANMIAAATSIVALLAVLALRPVGASGRDERRGERLPDGVSSPS